MSPRSAPGAAREARRRPQEPPGAPQERPKNAPRTPQEPPQRPRRPQERTGSHLGAILEPPGSILEPILADSRSTFGRVLAAIYVLSLRCCCPSVCLVFLEIRGAAAGAKRSQPKPPGEAAQRVSKGISDSIGLMFSLLLLLLRCCSSWWWRSCSHRSCCSRCSCVACSAWRSLASRASRSMIARFLF